MAIIRRNKETILGLKAQLDELRSRLDSNGSGLTETQLQTLNQITATMAIDLDTVLTDDVLSDNISLLGDDEKIATVKSIREYVLAALHATGPRVIIEQLPVNTSDGGYFISTNHLPHMGISGVFNYGTVRYRTELATYALPLQSVEDQPYRFELDVMEVVGVDTLPTMVDIQYLYYLDPRELNDLIGQIILDGLVLITNNE